MVGLRSLRDLGPPYILIDQPHHVPMARSTRLWFYCLSWLLFAANAILAAEAKPEDEAQGTAFFEAKIRPMLVEHCYRCHSQQTNKSEGGMRLDSKEGIRTGGDRGPAIVPGKPEESLLLTAISHTDPDLKMPPKKERLPKSVIDDVEKWIRMGAPDPREGKATAPPRRTVNIE